VKVALLLFLAALAGAQTVDIGVFTLFRPVELVVTPASAPILIKTADTHRVMEGHQSFAIHAPVSVSSRAGDATDFILSIPGTIERRFHGVLTVRMKGRKLIPIVTMDREIAVASVVAAEMPADAPIEALKAQAVAARSFYAAAGPRHDSYAFCDTTHCQFLREPPATSRAQSETRGLTIEYQGHTIAALYSAACGGRTRARDAADYCYRAVDCDYCQRHSQGVVQGHQLGLCQNGASGMAASGASFRAILDRYYPASTISDNVQHTFSTFFLPPSEALRHSKD
jgi:peptidoglycan hydrolase-like amidase